MKTITETRMTIAGQRTFTYTVPELEDHKPACREATLAVERARLAWAMQHPGYCRDCDGWGGATTYGVRYYKDGSGEPDSWDPCPSCSGAEPPLCPHCGEELPFDGMEPDDFATVWECEECGWAEARCNADGTPRDAGKPYEYGGPCHCFEPEEEVEP